MSDPKTDEQVVDPAHEPAPGESSDPKTDEQVVDPAHEPAPGESSDPKADEQVVDPAQEPAPGESFAECPSESADVQINSPPEAAAENTKELVNENPEGEEPTSASRRALTERTETEDAEVQSSKKQDIAPTALLEKEAGEIDEEASREKLKYPKSVFFIVTNEFCERFSYYGMRAILVLYLTSILRYGKDDATVIYHIFTMFCYFFPLIGSIIADSWLGKFNTIFFLSIVYALGNIVVSVASAESSINIPGRALTILGLLLIAFGTGGIKPCVSAFGGDQFKIPQQEKQMAQFFSLFYFAINSGSLLSTFITPILREDVTCLDQDSCYPLAFGVPAILMVVSILVFVAGKKLYVVKKPQGNVVLKVFKCIGHAVAEKTRSKGVKHEHWLDYASDLYDTKLIEDIKMALRVLFLYLPLPFFWALFDQQGSRWTFQATMMTGDIGGWSLKPDQMQVVNPLLILLFIPLFETIIYPVLKKCNLLTKPLQRLGVGGVLAALAFGISAIVELNVEKSYAVEPKSGEGQIRIFNGLDCDATSVNINGNTNFKIPAYHMWKNLEYSVSEEEVYVLTYEACNKDYIGHITVAEKKALSYLISADGFINITSISDIVTKGKENARLRVLYNNFDATNVTIGDKIIESYKYGESDLYNFTSNGYRIQIDGKEIDGQIDLKIGGVYTLMLSPNKRYDLFEITPPNDVHMLWLIPQYVVLTMGEVMFSITGLEFSYSQAPLSMKSVMQAGWLLTVAFGNLIVVIIAEAKFFDRQFWEFILFAGLMLVDMVIFAFMARGYKYVEAAYEVDLPLDSTDKGGIENVNFKKDDEM